MSVALGGSAAVARVVDATQTVESRASRNPTRPDLNLEEPDLSFEETVMFGLLSLSAPGSLAAVAITRESPARCD